MSRIVTPEEIAGSYDKDALWTPLGLIAPLEARVGGHVPARPARGISIDTRSLRPDDLFFAIRGDRTDGHDYVAAAFAKGAMAAVVDEAHADRLAPLGPLYVVHDVLPALERLGTASRGRNAARIIAVTGSVGKTSTKETLRLALTQAGKVHASVASYNNHWGVPLTLARMPRDTDFGIYEIGMNHAGEITPLVGMVRPHMAIITTVAPVHLEYFDSVEAIADAKAEIFSGLMPGGVAIVHRDIAQFDRIAAAARRSPAGLLVSFGRHEEADARLLDLEPAPDHSMVTAEVQGKRLTYRLGAPGRHFAENSLAVLLAAKACGVPLDDAAAVLAFSTPQAGRGQQLLLEAGDGPFRLIDESYNANPASMRAAVEFAGTLPLDGIGRRIAVLGDMLELGDRAPQLHQELAEVLREARFDLVFAAGPLMRHLFDALPSGLRGEWRPTAGELAPLVAAVVRRNDIVLIKGSNGSRMAAVVESLKEKARLAGVETV